MQCHNLSAKRVDKPNESSTLATRPSFDTPPAGEILARLRTSTRAANPKGRDMDKLPDPWILNTEKLLERLEKCRQQVMDIPIRSLEETQLGIRYALTEIVNLQEHLRFTLELHREAQQRFAKLAEKPTQPKRRGASQAAKLVSFGA